MELVVAGRVRRAWGIKGQLSVDWTNGSCPVEVGSGFIYLKIPGEGAPKKFVLMVDHFHSGCNVISLKGLTSRTEAERYKGLEIWVEKGELPELKDNEFYSYQLLGMRVETTVGEHLGEIVQIFSTGSNDVYVVKKDSTEILLPAISDVVKKIDVEGKLMIIELIEGLR